MKNKFFTLIFSCFFLSSFGNEVLKETDTIEYKISPDDRVLVMIDSLLNDKYFNSFGFCMDTIGNLSADSIPDFSDSIYEKRLQQLNAKTPFDLRYNQYTAAFINLYVNKRRKLSSSVLRLAPYYFPMIEETLDRFNMPLELKYLAVVESALNPSAKSRVGAMGLWQFMYRTGKMYNLNVTSYYDDRMNPYKATIAACEYMSDLYRIYGDWSLVLAAYNSGPGNVNKAIRRSGGHKDYWKIRAWLPRETRGYVPAFIAVNYMMNFAEEHNIYPESNQLFSYEVDTVEVNQSVSFNQLATYINIDEKELAFYNPMYKLQFIPESDHPQTLCMPVDKIGLYLVNEKAIFADIKRKELADSAAGIEKEELIPEMLVHYVRSGEFLGYIANKYGCSVRDLMAWNNLRSTRLSPGDRLKVFTKNQPGNASAKTEVASKPEKTTEEVKQNPNAKYQIHVVRSGDTLWDIAKEYQNTSVNELKRLNGNLNFNRLKPGMQLKIKEIS